MLLHTVLGERTKQDLIIFLLSKSQQKHSSCLTCDKAAVYSSFFGGFIWIFVVLGYCPRKWNIIWVTEHTVFILTSRRIGSKKQRSFHASSPDKGSLFHPSKLCSRNEIYRQQLKTLMMTASCTFLLCWWFMCSFTLFTFSQTARNPAQ